MLALAAACVGLAALGGCGLLLAPFAPLGAVAQQIGARPQPWLSIRCARRARVWVRTARGFELRCPFPADGATAAAGGSIRDLDLLPLSGTDRLGAGVLLDDEGGYAFHVVPLRRTVHLDPADWRPKPPWFAELVVGEVVAGMPRWAAEVVLGRPNQVAADGDRVALRYDRADGSVRFVVLDRGVVVDAGGAGPARLPQRGSSPSASTKPR